MIALLCGAAPWSAARAAPAAIDYSAPASWLCLPGRADVCAGPLTSTVIDQASGERSTRAYAPDPGAPIDCFYVYPTVSREPAGNADMAADADVQHAAKEQFARFGAQCHTFAPLYRQTTLAAMEDKVSGADSGLAYADVLNAWRFYLSHYNKSRGVVLIGSSQGAGILARLIAEEIDGAKTRGLLVSAILVGTSIQVPVGRTAGGTFAHVPLCAKADQTGCVIAYSTYLADSPPGANAAFGASAGPGLVDACVNPGLLTDAGVLDAELPTTGEVARTLGTDLVENPGLLTAACTTAGSRTFLGVSVGPSGSIADRLSQALANLDGRRPGFGLHALDINIALGNLVEIVGRQARAWKPS